jgi:hypothetical protein
MWHCWHGICFTKLMATFFLWDIVGESIGNLLPVFNWMHFICLLKPPALNDLWEMTRVPSPDSSTDSMAALFARIPTNTKNVFSDTILPWGVKDYVQQPMWKLVVPSANISCNFFSYCNFSWLCNLGGGNCTDENLFPFVFCNGAP